MSNFTSNINNGDPIFYKGRMVGYPKGNCLIKHAHSKKHMLMFPKGWAIETELLTRFDQLGIKVILIIDQDSTNAYRAKLSSFYENGIPIDRGFGNQICLPLEFWKISPRKHYKDDNGFTL
jgi:hypothetical protein